MLGALVSTAGVLLLCGAGLVARPQRGRRSLEEECYDVGSCTPAEQPQGTEDEICKIFEDSLTCMQRAMEACQQLDFPQDTVHLASDGLHFLRKKLHSHCSERLTRLRAEEEEEKERKKKEEEERKEEEEKMKENMKKVEEEEEEKMKEKKKKEEEEEEKEKMKEKKKEEEKRRKEEEKEEEDGVAVAVYVPAAVTFADDNDGGDGGGDGDGDGGGDGGDGDGDGGEGVGGVQREEASYMEQERSARSEQNVADINSGNSLPSPVSTVAVTSLLLVAMFKMWTRFL